MEHPQAPDRTRVQPASDPLETCALERKGWRGGSGTEYVYWVYPLGTRFPPAVGNYIFARRGLTGGWESIYVGYGDLSRAVDLVSHYRGDEIQEKGATHLHVRENGDETSGLVEKSDLLEGNPEAYAPRGCNPPVE